MISLVSIAAFVIKASAASSISGLDLALGLFRARVVVALVGDSCVLFAFASARLSCAL